MLEAIDFDDEMSFTAREVGEVLADWFLLAPLPVKDLPVAQVAPEMHFGVSGVAAKRAREGGALGVID